MNKLTIFAFLFVVLSASIMTSVNGQDCGENEQFFKECESSTRDECPCENFAKRDCRTGCMCKNGFCKKDGVCVKRDCVHPLYD
ncbi:hypothetical protein PVAND_017169 [Polypedilum vanderplanki]|uniref:TIL domain-containing protein n=1 Tax=Polypedilum vanderplanki TaxID=319348 RepID=A0A9J6BI88_POLVA|nr:hypothetical protein PVAND_017169 [Polypedilum vanderplanki]